VQRAVKFEIRKASENYTHKIELKFKRNDMRRVWEGIKIMSDMQQNPQCLSSLVFAEDMNFSILILADTIVFVIDNIKSSTGLRVFQMCRKALVLMAFLVSI